MKSNFVKPVNDFLEEDKSTKKTITNPNVSMSDIEVDNALRPKKLSDFTGQEKLKNNLHYAIQSAKARGEHIDHIMFYGPPGLGKTTLAEIVANELEVSFSQSSGPVLQKAGDIVGLLTNLKDRDVIFIDEIHRLTRNIEEYLYPAMEDYEIDIMMDSGPGAKNIKLSLEKFTLVGATTMAGSISKPMRDRFGILLKLEYYTPDDLTTIIKRSASLLQIEITEDAAIILGERSRGTPRIANRLLKRSRDVAVVDKKDKIDLSIVEKSLTMLGVDENGLDETDIEILKTIIEHYNGGPVGLKSIAMVIGEESDTIEEMYEPFLVQKGFIRRTPRGRSATKKAYDVVGIKYKKKNITKESDLGSFF